MLKSSNTQSNLFSAQSVSASWGSAACCTLPPGNAVLTVSARISRSTGSSSMTRKLSDCIVSGSSGGIGSGLLQRRWQHDFDARSIRPGGPELHLPCMPADNAPADRQAGAHALRSCAGIELPEHPKRLFVIGGRQADAIVGNASDPAVAPGFDEDAHATRPAWLAESDRVQDQLLEHAGQQIFI